MSHYFTIALVPVTSMGLIESKVAAIMEPFDEKIEVPEYEEPCDCQKWAVGHTVCNECNGSSVRMTTYNPHSKWDDYAPGGQYNGVIRGNPRDSADSFNYDKEFRQLPENVIESEALLERVRAMDDALCFAMVTVKGWVQRDNKRWFANPSQGPRTKDPRTWMAMIEMILSLHPAHAAVGLDCHM